MPHKIGYACILYRNTGTDASPTWAIVEGVQDLNLDETFSEADVSARDGNGETFTDVGLVDKTLTFGMLHDMDDADYDALLTASRDRTAIQFAVADAAIATTGTVYYKFFAKCTNKPWSQNLNEGSVVEFTWKPTRHREAGSLVVPSWVEVV